MAKSIEMTAKRFCDEFLNHFDYCSQASCLLVGNVQSGKTGQMLGLISVAADMDFSIFVILTTDNVLLQQQTLDRVRQSLPDYCVCDEDDSVAFERNNGILPSIIVLKKNARTLRRWEKTFLTSRVAEGNPLFIIDDEADAASLNAKVNEQDISTINKHIAAIRQDASSSIYLEVTGTPQSIFLQTKSSNWQPDYVFDFQPGDAYVGGNFFFSGQNPVMRSIGFTDDDANPIKTFVVRHLAVSAITLMQGERTSNALAHVSARTSDHAKVRDEIQQTLHELQDSSKLTPLLRAELLEINEATLVEYNASKIAEIIIKNLIPETQVIVKNSKSDSEATFKTGCNFIVGGNSLGRGVTIPKLNTVLYTRLSKRPQADTIWQHNRIFGYDRNRKLIRVYMTKHLWKLLSEINDQNESIYAQIRAGIKKVKISFPPEISPTRREVVDRSSLKLLAGGVNRYPDALRNVTLGELDDLLKDIDSQGWTECPLGFLRRLLSFIQSDDEDFSTEDYDGIFEQLLAENPEEKAILIVRHDRSITQGTGALLSPNDWKLGERFPNQTVATLYRIAGEKGWGGSPLWVPNIRLPHNRNFFVMKR